MYNIKAGTYKNNKYFIIISLADIEFTPPTVRSILYRQC